jgi:subtilisin-like proprotein convertase family protein
VHWTRAGPLPALITAAALAGAPAASAQFSTPDFDGGGLTIADGASAAPYPSTIAVNTDRTIVEAVTVRLNAVSHQFPDDLDVLLVGPGGQNVMLLSDAAGADQVSSTLRFDDAATSFVPDDVFGGTWKPTNVDDGSSDALPAPAPAGPFGDALSTFRLVDPNGTWSLYAVDDDNSDLAGGSIASWRLTLTARRGARVFFGDHPTREGHGPMHVVFTRTSYTTPEAPLYPATWSFETRECPQTPPCAPAFHAEPGKDYTPVAGTLNWAAGETQKTVDIEILDDHVPEEQELLYVAGTGATGDANVTGAQDQTIQDDDPKAAKPRVRAPLGQRPALRRFVSVTAKSNAWGRLAARGTISVPKASAVVRLRPAKRKVKAGEATAFRLRLAGKPLGKLRKAFEDNARLTANVTVTATDLAGNRASRTVHVKVRR